MPVYGRQVLEDRERKGEMTPKIIIQIIIILPILWIVVAIAIAIHLIYGFSIDQAIGTAIGIVGLPFAYILGIGAAVNKHFNGKRSKPKSDWTTIKPGHIVRNL